MSAKILLVSLVLLVSACTLTGKVVQEIIPEESSSFKPEIHFCSREDCVKIIIDFISGRNKVDCAFYELTDKSLLAKLTEVKARVIVHKDIKSHPGLMHDKFCIIDDSIILTGSFNPTSTAKVNDNNLVIIHSAYLAENYNQEFSELLGNQFAKGEKVPHKVVYLNGRRIENYFCPEDSCKAQVLRILSTAQKSIDFMVFSFASDDIADKLIEKHSKGIEIHGVTEKFQSSSGRFEKLKSAGIDVVYDSNKNIMHHKVFIVDNEVVITGSFNPSVSADKYNDENILVFFNPEIASLYSNEFKLLR